MSYKAVLFGSIGTLAETSDLQRDAFNEAFKISGLDWFWDEDIYRKLLSKSGGTTRINDYAKETSVEIDGKKIRNLKTKIFNELFKYSLKILVFKFLIFFPSISTLVSFA